MALWNPEHSTTKLLVLAGVVAITLGVHYGWLIDPVFGHVHWLHSIHGRFCYIPIVIGAAWFGLRGGLLTALIISILIVPYLLQTAAATDRLVDELAEILFYFAIASLSGALFDRELFARKRAEDMRLQLERSQKLSLVGQIAAGVAHEIKNPLASIKGAVEILCDQSTSKEERKEFERIVLKEIERMNGSVTDFLEFARPREPRLSVINLSDVVRDSLRQIEAQAGKQNIRINQEIQDKILVNGDSEKIHQVILNIVLNAFEASKSGDQILVRVRADEQTDSAFVTVEDSGEGLGTIETERFFEPFYTTKSAGTGLGLAVARTIIEQHNGRIQLHSRPNVAGTIAEIRIPKMKVSVI